MRGLVSVRTEAKKYGTHVARGMPKFIDSHPMEPFTEAQLKAAQKAPRDEFGVTHHDILYNKAEGKLFCVLDAPDRKAIEKHHAKAGVRCDWIQEVTSTRV